ncbi:MAG: tRNA (adenosine(37)-N6)-dimethylallyltransferase MiaA [Hyphomonadaceae bacterium]|nr:tRNA (adenosine(37)-N6)-dimethylallyltransferase MiaA [Hyphomonadaceae bacterium]
MTRALLIMGPTASGKSALALALAARLGGEILNADSMQVYAGLRVLTARPTEADAARAPHHLYGHVDPAIRYSTGAWVRAAHIKMAEVADRGAVPILVGGTGLYFRALTHGLVDIPEPPPKLRAALEADLAAEGPEIQHAHLATLDPQAAGVIMPRDGQRILRALAVRLTTGVSIVDWWRGTRPVLAADGWLGVALTPPRAALYGAIDARFAAMLADGAVAEAEALAARSLDPGLPAMKAHGLPWLMAHLRGEMSLADAAGLAARDTRRYAKRQFTWIAHQTPDWPTIADTALNARVAHVCALWDRLDTRNEAN